jgi:hypothetical protein
MPNRPWPTIALSWAFASLGLCVAIVLWSQAAAIAGRIDVRAAADADALTHALRAASVATAAGSLYVFMLFAADAMFPRTPRPLSGTLKTIAAVAMWTALAWTAWALWRAWG